MALKINPAQITAVKRFKMVQSQIYSFVPAKIKFRFFGLIDLSYSEHFAEFGDRIETLPYKYRLENGIVYLKPHITIWLADGDNVSFYFESIEGMNSEYLRLSNLAGLTHVKNN